MSQNRKLKTENLIIGFEPGGFAEWTRFCQFFGIDKNFLTVETPTGGAHVYFSVCEKILNNRCLKKNLIDFPEIYFLTEGDTVPIPSAENNYIWDAMNEFGGFVEIPAPEKLINELAVNPFLENVLIPGKDIVLPEIFKLSKDQIKLFLTKIDPKDDQKTKQVANTLKFSGNGFFTDFVKFIKDQEKAEILWSEAPAKNPIPLAKIANQKIFDDETEKFETAANAIAIANTESIAYEIIPKLQNEKFSGIHLEKIALIISDKFFENEGVKIDKNQIVAALKPGGTLELFPGFEDKFSKEDFFELYEKRTDIPEWCKKWVYISAANAMIDLNTGVLHKRESFNMENTHRVPRSKKGHRKTAWAWVEEYGNIRNVDIMYYMPNRKERFF